VHAPAVLAARETAGGGTAVHALVLGNVTLCKPKHAQQCPPLLSLKPLTQQRMHQSHVAQSELGRRAHDMELCACCLRRWHKFCQQECAWGLTPRDSRPDKGPNAWLRFCRPGARWTRMAGRVMSMAWCAPWAFTAVAALVYRLRPLRLFTSYTLARAVTGRASKSAGRGKAAPSKCRACAGSWARAHDMRPVGQKKLRSAWG